MTEECAVEKFALTELTEPLPTNGTLIGGKLAVKSERFALTEPL